MLPIQYIVFDYSKNVCILQLDRIERIELVLNAAEKHLGIPSFLDESLLFDDRVCSMYLGLIYLATVNKEKACSFTFTLFI